MYPYPDPYLFVITLLLGCFAWVIFVPTACALPGVLNCIRLTAQLLRARYLAVDRGATRGCHCSAESWRPIPGFCLVESAPGWGARATVTLVLQGRTLYISRYMPYTVYFVLYTMYFRSNTIYHVLRIMWFTLYAKSYFLCAVYELLRLNNY